jgi:hypothetical protein
MNLANGIQEEGWVTRPAAVPAPEAKTVFDPVQNKVASPRKAVVY